MGEKIGDPVVAAGFSDLYPSGSEMTRWEPKASRLDHLDGQEWISLSANSQPLPTILNGGLRLRYHGHAVPQL